MDGIDLAVAEGEIYGFLGPNGAGKSTTVHMLTTLLPPTDGRARVAGFDVVKEGPKVRRAIGAALQEAALDPLLTGREHLRLQTALHGISKAERNRRSDELLERVGLEAAAERKVRTYSGGMKRRLDLALALVHRPAHPLPRRADDRARPAVPHRALGRGRTPRAGGRRHRLPHDAVPRGGRRAREPRRHHRPRADRGRGHARRAEGGDRAPDGGGDSRRSGAAPAARADPRAVRRALAGVAEVARRAAGGRRVRPRRHRPRARRGRSPRRAPPAARAEPRRRLSREDRPHARGRRLPSSPRAIAT